MNPVRGEVSVEIAGGKYVLAATMEGLSQLSHVTGCRTLHDLYERLIGTEIFTTLAALRALVQSGRDADGKDMKRKDAASTAALSFTLSDASAVQAAFVEMLGALTRQPDEREDSEPGNATTALN